MITMANELIAMSRFFTCGIPVNDNTLALDAIERVACGRSNSIFLMDDHTFENFMQSLFLPNLLDRSRYDAWKNDGANDLYQRCNIKTQHILSEHKVSPKPEDRINKINGIVSG
jgi:trimethylamine--corrinoid protein Co-methyltransferase